MEKNWLERTELLIKEDGLLALKNAHVLIVGLGGVGSFAAEFLTRSGVGKLTIVDGDDVDITNINRQLPALHSTIGKFKVNVVAERLLDINPNLDLIQHKLFLSPENIEQFFAENKWNFIVDCIDSVTPKVMLIKFAKRHRTKMVSCFGAGGKMDPSKVLVRDLYKTESCFLAKTVRKRLRAEHINKGVRCVFSTEIQDENSVQLTDGKNYKRSFYGTISYMPAIFGLYAAHEAIDYILKKAKKIED